MIRRNTSRQRLNKAVECLSSPFFDRAIVFPKWPPSLDLRYILQHDHAGTHQICPLDSHPRQTTNILIGGLTTLSTGEVFTVRAEPRERHRLTVTRLHRIDFPHVFTVMLGVGMVCSVHCNSIWVVVDGNINIASNRQLNSGTRTATTGKVIYKQPHIYLLLF